MIFLAQMVFWGCLICVAALGALVIWGVPLAYSMPVLLVVGAYLNSNGKLL